MSEVLEKNYSVQNQNYLQKKLEKKFWLKFTGWLATKKKGGKKHLGCTPMYGQLPNLDI